MKLKYTNQYHFLLITLILSFILTGCFEKEETKKAETSRPVRVIKIEKQNYPLFGEYVAQIQAFKTVEIRSRVEGYLKERHFKEGQVVDEGQLLFVIDPRPYQEDLNQATAELASTKAKLNKANKDFKRFKALFDQGAVSREEYDTKATDKEVLEATLSNSEANLSQAKLNLSFTKIYSPMKGIIGRTQVNLGALVAKESTLLVTISSIDPMYVNFSIPEKEYLIAARDRKVRLQKGDKPHSKHISMRLADGKVYDHKGTFSMADRAVDSSTGTLGIRSVFPNPDKILRDGQYAKVIIPLYTFENALIVPSRAFLDIQGRKSLMTVAQNGTVLEKSVTITYADDQNSVVEKGISENELIIVDGANKVRTGLKVTPIVENATK